MTTPKDETGSDNSHLFKGKTPRNVIIGIGALVAICVASLGFYTMSKQQAKQAAAALDAKAGKTNFTKASQGDRDPLDSEMADQEMKAKQDAQKAQRPSQPNSTRPSMDQDFPGQSSGGNGENQTRQDQIDQVYTAPIHKPGGFQVNQQKANAGDALADMSPDKLEARTAAGTSSGLAAQEAAELAAKMNGSNGAGTGTASTQVADLGFISNAKKTAEAGEGFSTATFVGQEKSCTLGPPNHIPVFTIEKISSDRPGRVALVVTDDVYDSVTGTCLMIPKGSKIVGPYSSDIRVGAERILVATTEMRLPNGKEVSLNGAQGADQDGAAGFSGDVNNHFLEIFGTSFLTAVLLGEFDKNSTVSTSTTPYGVSQVGTSAGQVAAQTSQSILTRYQNIPPTITVPPGQRFMIQINQDIHLEPYRD